MTDPNIAELRALYEAVPPGEWEAVPEIDGHHRRTRIRDTRSFTIIARTDGMYGRRHAPQEESNATLIAAMHNALPGLLDRAERAEQAERERDALRGIVRHLEEELNEAGVYLSGEFAELVDAALGEGR